MRDISTQHEECLRPSVTTLDTPPTKETSGITKTLTIYTFYEICLK